MKKIFALAALVLAFSFTAKAQLAIGAGYTDAQHKTVVGSTDPIVRHADNAYLEATYETTNEGMLHFFPGVKFCVNLNAKDKSVDKENFSIEVPLMGKLNIAVGEHNELFVFAGPSLLYSPALNNSSQSSSFTDGKNNLNVFIGGGLGFDLLNRFRIKAGYNYGLIDEAKSDIIKSNTSCIYGGIDVIL